MSQGSTSIPYTLHIWPSKWNLPSFDPTCVAAVLYLQLTISGKFKVIECTDPDLSSNGQLPFLTHGNICIPSLPSIISFVTALSKSSVTDSIFDIDASLNVSEKTKLTAWKSHVETNVGDLLSHMFYSLDANFWKLTNPAIAPVLPIPQRFYVPQRIRDSHRPRLEAAGLWNLPGIEEEKKSPFERKEKNNDDDPKETFVRAFEREKVSEKTRTILDIYSRLLGDKPVFFGTAPTTLDIYLAAHILLLLDAPFPDPLVQTILKDSYPMLIDHARHVQAQAASRCPRYEIGVTEQPSLLSMIPRPLSSAPKDKSKINPDDTRYRRMRWTWIALAVGAIVFRLAMDVKIVRMRAQQLRTLPRAEQDGASVDEEINADPVDSENVDSELEEEDARERDLGESLENDEEAGGENKDASGEDLQEKGDEASIVPESGVLGVAS
ncbi:hypothetical protein BJ138DRAFT_563355 [Hygrophoropsis aurantiaca]|uniref:Uncharacterized protein n=1 Tax=Hygrophoropsis aurantiaca TaxID=72124 RepID=A0ACB8AMH0_9AGAM|nr:hypothetical protein BJ138DRAFT_563355 [Hygrophoropsis aurantiaca]